MYKTHGLTKSQHYHRWRGMMWRCYDPSCPAYKNYGGRGIRVCDRWHDLTNFVSDLPPGYRKGLEIDRIDNDGNYEPGNIKWSTRRENTGNRRSARLITSNGKTQSLTEWSLETGLTKTLISDRIDTWGWSPEKALTEPIADKTENMRRAQSQRWAGHVKKPEPKPLVIKTFMFNGRPQTIREISQYTGISMELLRKRLCERKWPIDKVTRII